jgi:hypothetical protein
LRIHSLWVIDIWNQGSAVVLKQSVSVFSNNRKERKYFRCRKTDFHLSKVSGQYGDFVLK